MSWTPMNRYDVTVRRHTWAAKTKTIAGIIAADEYDARRHAIEALCERDLDGRYEVVGVETVEEMIDDMELC